MFPCEFCEISKNTFSYRTPPLPVSESNEKQCRSRANNNKMNRLHERCPIIINFVKELLYETLLKKDGCVSIHNKYSNFCCGNL